MQAGVYVSLNQVSIIILLFKQFIIHSLHHLVSSMNVSKIQVFQQMIEINGFNTNLYEWKVLSLSLFEWLEKMNMYYANISCKIWYCNLPKISNILKDYEMSFLNNMFKKLDFTHSYLWCFKLINPGALHFPRMTKLA